MKKLIILAFAVASMAGVAHAAVTTGSAPSSASAPSSNTAGAPQTSVSGNFVPLAPIPGLTQGAVANSSGLANFLNNLYKYLIGVAAILAVIEIIWGGLEISTKDSVSKKSDGKARITQAILGLILVLSPVLVFSIINPSILNLSLNLPPIAISPGTYGGAGAQTPTVDTATGCSVVGGNYLKTATCPSSGTTDAKSVASQWLSNNCNTSFFGLFGSDSSPVTCELSSSGFCTQASVSCDSKSPQSYLLIDIGPQSLLSANMEPFDAQTSASLSQFVNGCNGDGGAVCTNQLTSFVSETSCPPHPSLPASASQKCFNQSYYCFDSADASIGSSFVNKVLSSNSSGNYLCQPSLQFTLQPLNP